MTKWITFAGVIALACALAMPVWAQPPEGRGPGHLKQAYKKADEDGDGKVTFDELSAVAPNLPKGWFERWDADGDGVLTLKELPKGPPPRRGRRGVPGGPGGHGHPVQLFKIADADGDGNLTYDEITAKRPGFPKQVFKRWDKDGDGIVTKGEMPKGPPAGAEGRPGPGRQQRGTRMFMEADADKDGKLTYAELSTQLPRFPEKRFDELDTDDDGMLTPEELRKGRPGGPATGRPGGPPEGGGEHMRIFRQADKNRDGKASYDEVKAVMPGLTQEAFDDIDKNGDGFITKDELPRGPGPGSPAAKPSREGGHMKTFLKADADKNGKVTHKELKKVAPEISKADFDSVDANDDGVITKKEVPRDGGSRSRKKNPMMESRNSMAKQLEELDADGDGKTTFEEVQAAKPGFPKTAFDRYDKNDDGAITQDDFPNR